MATTKKAEVANTEARDPWSEMVTIKLPRPERHEENYVTVSVNGRVFKIQRGVAVEVPAPIAEVLEHSETAKIEADDFIMGKVKAAEKADAELG